VHFRDYIKAIDSITLQECENWLADHFTEDHRALSVIMPVSK